MKEIYLIDMLVKNLWKGLGLQNWGVISDIWHYGNIWNNLAKHI